MFIHHESSLMLFVFVLVVLNKASLIMQLHSIDDFVSMRVLQELYCVFARTQLCIPRW